MALEKIKNIIRRNIPYEQADYGKLIRSRVGIAFAKSYGIEISESLILLCSAIELIHTASLLHDDVIDEESFRRNSESVNRKEGNKKAVLYGDVILADAMKIVLNLGSDKITNVILSAIHDMCEGELLQFSQIGIIPDLGSYIKKCELKTGSLFKALIKSICLIINKPDISNFGLNFGIAFQIKNDLDNVLNIGSDTKAGIYTAPIIYSGTEHFSESGIEKTKSLIDNYKGKCIKDITVIKDGSYKEELIGVVKCLSE